MSDLHIDDFYHDCGLALARLYSVFPRPSIVWVEDISGPDTADEFGLHSDRHIACFSALLWLADEGYIKFQTTIRQEGLDQAILTQKAFLLLSSITRLDPNPEIDPEAPVSIQEHASLNIHQLRHAIKAKDSYRIRQVVHYLLHNSSR